MTTDFPKGSEWRRWDYHVHTPASWYYEYHGDDAYDRVAEAIRDSPCAAFGINDYVTIDGYLKLRGMVEKPIFPVVEFRMTHILPQRKGGGDPLDFHLLFSNDEQLVPEIEALLNSLQFKDFNGTARNLTDQELVAFGKQVDSTKTDAAELKRAALSKVRFDFEGVMQAVKDKGLREKCLLILPYDEHHGIDGIDPLEGGLVKSGFVKAADILGSSSEAQREYFLGKAGKYTPEQFKLWVGRPKPIIKGSDAHAPDAIGILPRKKDDVELHCWIKADLTFEGLKQILYEPEERIFIGSTPPDNKDQSKVIKSIEIRGAGEWFEDQKIDLNRDLVTIIGGKGSGKTALVDLLGLGGGDFDKDNQAAFLYKAGKELVGAKILLQWEDGSTEDELEITRPPMIPTDQKVRYLSQSFVESLCSFDRHHELEAEIEEILFQYIPDTQREGAERFDALKEKKTEGIRLEIENIASTIRHLNADAFALNQLIASRPGLEREKANLEKDITELHKQKPKPSSDAERKIIGEVQKLTEQRVKVAAKAEALRIKLTKLDVIRKRTALIGQSIQEFNREVAASLKELGEEALGGQLTIALPVEADTALSGRAEAVAKELSLLEGAEGVEGTTLYSLDKAISELNKKSSFETQKKKKLDEFNRRIAELTQKRDALGLKITSIDKNSRKEVDAKRALRKTAFLAFFKKLEEKRKVLEELYRPLNERAGASDEEKKVEFYAKFTFDKDKFASAAKELFHGSKSVIRGLEGFQELGARYWEAMEASLPEAEDFEPLQKMLEALVHKDKDTTVPIGKQLRDKKTPNDVANWAYSVDYYDVEYGINYEGTDLDKLSPGKKGVVLLLIYLTLDKDYRPLIVDQPEENLDNRSVFKTLVEYFRKAKQNRQVIVVTHNSNLVVNGDSEQVIVANFEKTCETQPARIKYLSGSLENTRPFDASVTNVLDQQGIREHVCELLEGGDVAFIKREEKYSLPKLPVSSQTATADSR